MDRACAMIRLIVLFLPYLFYFNDARDSQYLKTKTIKDTCDGSTLISEGTTRNAMQCATLCSSSNECRRYRVCVEDGTIRCSLFFDGSNCVTHLPVDACKCYRKKHTCENGICICPIGYYGDKCEHIITDCTEGFKKGWTSLAQKISFVKPTGLTEPFEMICYFNWNGLSHTMIRDKSCSTVDFNRTWNDYLAGFGDATGEYWIGLRNFYQMSVGRPFTLNILAVVDNSYTQCYYNNFAITNNDYRLQISSFFPHNADPCGDSWTSGSVNINNMPFSTFDHDQTSSECPKSMKGGGWFSTTNAQCTRGNIFGQQFTWEEGFTSGQVITKLYLRFIGK